jgi:hypothetical protein
MNIGAPQITATMLRQALATRAGVVVQDALIGTVYALPQGMTKLQTMDDTLVVIVTNQAAQDYVLECGGSYGRAAKLATLMLAWELETIEVNLSRYAERRAA